MRQTLFHIQNELGPLPIFGAGWLLILWAVFAGGLLAWQFIQRRPMRDALAMAPFLLIVAGVIYWLFPLLEDEQGLPIRGYGVMLLIAVLSGAGTAMRRGAQVGIDAERIYSLGFLMFIFGIAGARLFYVLQHWGELQQANVAGTVLGIVKVTDGGLVVYGSLFGAALAFLIFSVKHRISVFRLGDVVAPSMVLGLAIGRLGCLLNGCCFGHVCEPGQLGITFPRYSNAQNHSLPYHHQLAVGELHGLSISLDSQGDARVAAVRPNSVAEQAGVQVGTGIRAINGVSDLTDRRNLNRGRKLELTTMDGRQVRLELADLPARSLPVHPTQVYASVNGLLIFLMAWFFFPFRRKEGQVCGVVLTVYPVTRILLEWIRADEIGRLGTTLTISQLISLLILAAMAVFWLAVHRQPAMK